jgi:uncharacterized protein with GYD domain
MPKYLVQACYTGDGAKGLVAEGGSKRRETAGKAIAAAGGKLESFHFAFGTTDVFAVVDFPDNISAAAASLAINSSGLVHNTLTVLLTAEEVDAAAKKAVPYRGPGQ